MTAVDADGRAEKQALAREAARHRLQGEADRELTRLATVAADARAQLGLEVLPEPSGDVRGAFLEGYAAGGLAALPERFAVPNLAVLDEPLTSANAAAQALAHFDSLMFTAGGDRRLAIEAALTCAIDIGTALVAQGLAGER